MGKHIKYLVKACSLQLWGENSLAPIHIYKKLNGHKLLQKHFGIEESLGVTIV
jgi:hypothetical protein